MNKKRRSVQCQDVTIAFHHHLYPLYPCIGSVSGLGIQSFTWQHAVSLRHLSCVQWSQKVCMYTLAAFTYVVRLVTEAVASRLSKWTSLRIFLTGLKSSTLPLVTLKIFCWGCTWSYQCLLYHPLEISLLMLKFFFSFFFFFDIMIFVCVLFFCSNRVLPLRCTVQWLRSWKAWVGCTSTTVSAVCHQGRPRTRPVPSACGSSVRGWCRSDPAAFRHCDPMTSTTL